MEQKVKKSKKTTKTENEILEILAKAEEVATESLFVGEEGDVESVDEVRQIILGDTDDPESKHELYYQGIQKLLKSGLPTGKRFAEVSELVREEVNTFLARGKRKKNGIRGADSRMGYISDMEAALNQIIEWHEKRGTPVELYNEFKSLNDQFK